MHQGSTRHDSFHFLNNTYNPLPRERKFCFTVSNQICLNSAANETLYAYHDEALFVSYPTTRQNYYWLCMRGGGKECYMELLMQTAKNRHAYHKLCHILEAAQLTIA